MSSFGFGVFWPLTLSVEKAYGDRPTFFTFFLGLEGTHIPQLCGLVLLCNTPPTCVTQALIPLATDEEGLFQQPCILSFCGSMGCQDPFTLCVHLRYPTEALGPSLCMTRSSPSTLFTNNPIPDQLRYSCQDPDVNLQKRTMSPDMPPLATTPSSQKFIGRNVYYD